MKKETLRKIEKWNNLNKIERQIATQGYADLVDIEKLTLQDCYDLAAKGYEVKRAYYSQKKLVITF